ncbi:MAG: hypothetical protein ABI574_18585 [Burkholderiales bacterium]
MPRLQSETHRLYHPTAGTTDEAPGLIDPQGRVRALVLELARPADASLLSTVWQGVQADLGLPAPGMAVSGTDGLQLWFSLAEPVSAARGHAFLAALQRRYLADVAPARVRLMPASDEATTLTLQTLQVPALHAATGNWSAFIAPDLAPLFAETPWLDVPPGDEAQASLLMRLASIDARGFDAAWAQLQQVEAAVPAAQAPQVSTGDAGGDPVRFLLSVMNDANAPLALRVDAAKALLPWLPPAPTLPA